MTSPLRVHFEAIKASIAGRMAYRGDFFISISLALVFEFLTPLVTLLIYKSGSSFPGWSLYEVLLIQAIFMMAKGIAFMFFFDMVQNVLRTVREGTFDTFMLRPRSVLYMIIATSFNSEEAGKFLSGFALFVIALIHIPSPGLIQWVEFLLLMLISLLVLFSFALISSGVVFAWVGNSRVYEMFDSVSNFGLYPRTIFAKGLQNIISYAVPIIMIGFIPASVLLGKSVGNIAIVLCSSAIFFIVSLYFWHFMLRRHTSAGG